MNMDRTPAWPLNPIAAGQLAPEPQDPRIQRHRGVVDAELARRGLASEPVGSLTLASLTLGARGADLPPDLATPAPPPPYMPNPSARPEPTLQTWENRDQLPAAPGPFRYEREAQG